MRHLGRPPRYTIFRRISPGAKAPAKVGLLNPKPALDLGDGTALHAPKPTPMITLTNDEVGCTAVIPELLGPRYR
jgi:hypothetical protein